MGTETCDLVGDLLFKAGNYGNSHDHHSQTQGNSKHGNAHNGTRETASFFPAADQAAYDKEFGIQVFLICSAHVAIF